MDEGGVLALYGFRGKQEFIYRTNRMKEITGASELLASMFERFLEKCDMTIDMEWEDVEWHGLLDNYVGAVVYEGGGNLCMLFKDKTTYLDFNRGLSLYVLNEATGLGLISACAPYTGDFKEDMKALHEKHDLAKRLGSNTDACTVLPYTKVDRKTYLPIVCTKAVGDDVRELTREGEVKHAAYERRAKSDPAWEAMGKEIDNIGTLKGKDSLIAVVYCDGNSIGEKLKGVNTINDMRAFSKTVHDALVRRPVKAIEEALPGKYREHRVIIDHGDEITLVVNAHVVPLVLKAYFDAVEQGGYRACAGVALCHAHDPFAAVYKIAEECCESGKAQNRKTVIAGGNEGSYIDFHFCRSGITGTLVQIRQAQEAPITLRPYAYKGDGVDFESFMEVGCKLKDSKIARADIKNLGNLILDGPKEKPACGSRYRLEMERLKFKEGADDRTIEDIEGKYGEKVPKLLFDVAGFYDVWFENAPIKDGCRGESHE